MAAGNVVAEPGPPRLLDRVRAKIRLKHYGIRTEQAYVDRIKRFIVYHGKRHPVTPGASDVEAFLTDLAVRRGVSAATQNQAKGAILLLYRDILEQELPWLEHVERARTPARLPFVLTREEVARILARLHRNCGCPFSASPKLTTPISGRVLALPGYGSSGR